MATANAPTGIPEVDQATGLINTLQGYWDAVTPQDNPAYQQWNAQYGNAWRAQQSTGGAGGAGGQMFYGSTAGGSDGTLEAQLAQEIKMPELSAEEIHALVNEYLNKDGKFLQGLMGGKAAGLYNSTTSRLYANDAVTRAAMQALLANAELKSKFALEAYKAQNNKPGGGGGGGGGGSPKPPPVIPPPPPEKNPPKQDLAKLLGVMGLQYLYKNGLPGGGSNFLTTQNAADGGVPMNTPSDFDDMIAQQSENSFDDGTMAALMNQAGDGGAGFDGVSIDPNIDYSQPITTDFSQPIDFDAAENAFMGPPTDAMNQFDFGGNIGGGYDSIDWGAINSQDNLWGDMSQFDFDPFINAGMEDLTDQDWADLIGSDTSGWATAAETGFNW
jgi:hypothetical protein